jgi:hypothetical protein
MAIRDLRQTHTYAIMEVSKEVHEFIRQELVKAGYQHAIMVKDGKILLDMHGIALQAIE